MTDDGLLTTVANLVGQSKTSIQAKVEEYRRLGMIHIYSKTRPYWLKSEDTISLTSGSYIVDMADEVDDFLSLRYFWTSTGKLTPMSDERFREEYPNDTGVGEPHTYIPIGEHKFQLYPRSDGVYILKASYYYKPSFDTITTMPEEWHNCIMYYVLMFLQPKNSDGSPSVWFSFFLNSLEDVKAMTKSASVEEDPEIISDELQISIPDTMSNLER